MYRITALLFLVALSVGLFGCGQQQKGKIDMYKKYEVVRTTKPSKLEGNWSGGVWAGVDALEIKHWTGNEPEHKPKTQAKLLYDDNYIYVIFRVEDKYVRAAAKGYQGSVYLDSCAEFFFTPAADISQGYFNIEMNCGGTMLFMHQIVRGKDRIPVSDKDCDKIKIYHSEPKIVEPEKPQPTVWIIEYRVPFAVLEKYAPVTRPASGVEWRANFYKCADKTSHPHWLSWSVIDLPRADFHRPEFFGILAFK